MKNFSKNKSTIKLPLSGKKVLFTSHRAAFGNSFNRPLILLFKRLGAEVHYAANGEVPVEYCDKVYSISIQRSPFSIKNIKAVFELRDIVDTEQYDIIHCHTPTGSVVTRFAVAISQIRHRTKVIYTAHGFHFFGGAPLVNWVTFYPLEKFLARFTDILITINQEDYGRAKKRFKTDVRYVPGVGLDIKKFEIKLTSKNRRLLRRSLQLADSDFVMIYPAELSARKRQIWLIRALTDFLKRTPNAHLLLPGLDSLNGQCQKIIKDKGLSGQVHILGLRPDIPDLLQISDLAVSASLQEGLPVNIMESLYTGLPVVATDCRGNSELLHNTKNCIIVPKHDSAKFERGVVNVFNNRPVLDGNSQLKQEFYLASVLAKMQDLYMEVLDV